MKMQFRQSIAPRPIAFRRFLSLGVVLAVFSIVLMPRSAFAKPTEPTKDDKKIARLLGNWMEGSHLTRHPLDDQMSERCLTQFLKMLDPMKVYFYQKDVDEFMAQKDNIDDQIHKGDITLAYQIFDRYMLRLKERRGQIEKALKMKHDYELQEEIVSDADAAVYAKTEEEAFDRWRKRIKFDILDMTASGKVTEEEAITKLGRRYDNIIKSMDQTDNDELLEMYLTALTTSFDPHSTYMSRDTLENFYIMIGLQLEGIGASLVLEDGYTVIKKVIPGGAADKHGKLKLEDRIVGVGEGKDGEIIDVVDMKLNDVVKKIRGKAGTTVQLEVLTGPDQKREIYTIVRAKVELKESEARGRVIEVPKSDDEKDKGIYRIGVIDLPSFYLDMEGAQSGLRNFKRTTTDMRRIINELKEKQVDAIILDLRQNGGGSLSEAVETTGLFINDGPVVMVKSRESRVRSHDDDNPSIEWDGPLVVLTSKLSASASEILAGAIQDYKRGLIVGDKSTHGKGTVQQVFNIGEQLFTINPPNLGALKMTIQQFYRPNGDSTQNRGVLADVELPSITTHLPVGESDLDNALDFDHIDAMNHPKYSLVDTGIVSSLRALSENRWKHSDDFAKELKKINLYKKRLKDKTRTINREKFLAERKELDTEDEEEKLRDKLDNETIFDEKDFYNTEVLKITRDYLELLKGRKALVTQVGDSKKS